MPEKISNPRPGAAIASQPRGDLIKRRPAHPAQDRRATLQRPDAADFDEDGAGDEVGADDAQQAAVRGRGWCRRHQVGGGAGGAGAEAR